MSDKKFFGASFDTNDKPIGDRQSSATVIIKYPATNHNGETNPLADKYPAKAKTTKETAIRNNAIANFTTEEGSLDLLLNAFQIIDIIGASRIINKGFRD